MNPVKVKGDEGCENRPGRKNILRGSIAYYLELKIWVD